MLFVVRMTQHKEVEPAQLSQRFNNIKVIGMAGSYKKLNKLILKCNGVLKKKKEGKGLALQISRRECTVKQHDIGIGIDKYPAESLETCLYI